jgi:hypothetical protein
MTYREIARELAVEVHIAHADVVASCSNFASKRLTRLPTFAIWNFNAARR